jgi:hypothetical protein
MIDFDRTGQPVLPRKTKEWDGFVSSSTLPATLIADTASGATYTVLDGTTGLGGVTMVPAATSSASQNATILGPDFNPTGAVAIKLRAVVEITRGSVIALQAVDSNTTTTKGFGVGKYYQGSDLAEDGVTAIQGATRFMARSSASALYVKSVMKPLAENWDAAWSTPKKFDISLLLDIPGKSLYVAEGNQWVDMWENISAIDVAGTLKPQFRVVSPQGTTPANATLRRLTTTLYYR